jgi:hypothetical protein
MSEVGNRVSQSEAAALAQWERPELRQLDALDAEVAPTPTADGITLS